MHTTMQRENKRHRSHISDGWWTKFRSCQCWKLGQGLRYTWENEYLSIPLTFHQISASKQTHTHTWNITTSWPWPMMWNVAQGDGHSNVGRLSEVRWGFQGSQSELWRPLHPYGRKRPSEKDLMFQQWKNSRLDEDSDYCFFHSNERERDMAIHTRIMMAAADSVPVYEYNPQNDRLFL